MNPGSMRVAVLCALLAAPWGCSGSPLDNQPPPKVNNVTATGAVQGMFSAAVNAQYNRMSAKQQTVLGVVASNPGLGIRTFSFNALLGGRPEVTHYDERPAQITAGFYLYDGRVFESDVNSRLTIDISGVSAPIEQGDGSSMYTLQGVAGGYAPTTESGEIISFVITL